MTLYNRVHGEGSEDGTTTMEAEQDDSVDDEEKPGKGKLRKVGGKPAKGKPSGGKGKVKPKPKPAKKRASKKKKN